MYDKINLWEVIYDNLGRKVREVSRCFGMVWGNILVFKWMDLVKIFG